MKKKKCQKKINPNLLDCVGTLFSPVIVTKNGLVKYLHNKYRTIEEAKAAFVARKDMRQFPNAYLLGIKVHSDYILKLDND